MWESEKISCGRMSKNRYARGVHHGILSLSENQWVFVTKLFNHNQRTYSKCDTGYLNLMEVIKYIHFLFAVTFDLR